jgi:Protein of unknown function (DUF3822)
MLHLHIHESQYNPYNTDGYTLRLTIGQDGAAYIVSDEANNVLVWEAHPWETRVVVAQLHKRLQSLVRQDTVLQSNFAKTVVSITSPQTVLVPSAWFEPWESRLYLTRNLGDEPGDQVVKHDSYASYSTELIYALPQPLLFAISTCFPKVKLQHIHSAILEATRQSAIRKQHVCVYAYVRSGSLTICAADGEQLFLLNKYSYQTTKDFLYFVLLVYQQLNLNTKHTPLILAGELMPDSEIFKALHIYIRHIDWAERSADYKIGNAASPQVPPHFFNDLLHI